MPDEIRHAIDTRYFSDQDLEDIPATRAVLLEVAVELLDNSPHKAAAVAIARRFLLAVQVAASRGPVSAANPRATAGLEVRRVKHEYDATGICQAMHVLGRPCGQMRKRKARTAAPTEDK
jgi:hypothetical protein